MVNLVNVVSWIVLLTLLFITTFGVKLVLLCISSVVICLLSIYVALLQYAEQNQPIGDPKEDDVESSDVKLNLLTTPQLVKIFSKKCNPLKLSLSRCDSLCGDPLIDEQLKDITELLFRDIIIPWYSTISDNMKVIDDLKSILYSVIRNISSRIRQVDKVHYLTTQLVDDFASHLRLYRSAEQQLRVMKIQDANANLLSIFFDLEFQMEKNKVCRDVVSEHQESFINYLTHICDIIMYLLLSPEVFDNRLTRYSLRSILVNSLLVPLFQMLSDPDFINQSLIWLFKNKATYPSAPETFLILLRCCEDVDELNGVLEMVNKEIAIQRSKDTGGDDYFEVKQQLSSLLLVQTVIKSRLKCLNEGCFDDSDSSGLSSGDDIQKLTDPSSKLFQIPFDVVLKNNIALSYFIEYMSSINQQGYVYFYLNIEGFRVSAEQQLARVAAIGLSKSAETQSLREAALNIYETYLSPEKRGNQKVKVSEATARRIHNKLKNDLLSETWFDEAQEQVLKTMREDPTMFPSFKKSIHYVKLLGELDLLRSGEMSGGINNNNVFDSRSNSEEDGLSINSKTSLDSDYSSGMNMISEEIAEEAICDKGSDEYLLKVEINNTGIVREFGNSYGVYCISVARKEPLGKEEKWCVLRRYSDFDFFHQCLCDRFESQLRHRLILPGKRPFNNVNVDFLEQRRHLLNSYLQHLAHLCERGTIIGLRECVNRFLEPGNYEKEKTGISKTMNNLVVNSFKSSVKSMGNAVKAGSDNIKDSLQKLARLGSSSSSGLGSGSDSFNSRSSFRGRSNNGSSVVSHENGAYPQINSDKVGAALEAENELDNIPLRIMLLLMDEVFDLKSKSLWLRRRIVGVIRNIVKSTFGDTINRKILEYVEDLTSSCSISDYLKYFKNTMWPNNGKMNLHKPERDLSMKMRTKMSAKLLLLATFSEEIKHIIGTETTRKGLICVFQMFQNETFNLRLLIVLFEGLLHQLFPNNQIPLILMKLHSTSPRMKEYLQTNDSSIEWPPNLRRFRYKASSSNNSSNKSSPLHQRKK